MTAAPVRNTIKVIERIVDDVQAIGITIQDNAGAAIDITGRTFTVDIVDMSDDSVIGTRSASIVSAAAGTITFTPAAGDVDTAGHFALYAIDDSDRRFPYDGARLQLHIKAAGDA